MSANTSSSSDASGVKVPSSVVRVYDIPVIKDTVRYADSLLKSYALSGALLSRAEAIIITLYRTIGQPIQAKLQGPINQLDGLANKGLDYVQGKAPYIFETKTDDIVASARKPADQAYSTAKQYQDQAFSTAKSYQDLVTGRLHDTLLASQSSLSSLNERLAGAAATAKNNVPKNGKEAQELANQLVEQLNNARDTIAKQSGDLPSHVSKSLQPYVEKLQKGASDVQSELAKKDVPIHAKAQNIIGITREITTESLTDAIEALKSYVATARSKAQTNGDGAIESAKANGNKAIETAKSKGNKAVDSAKTNGDKAAKSVKTNGKSAAGSAQTNGDHAVESTEEFIHEHAPDGQHSFADVVKEN